MAIVVSGLAVVVGDLGLGQALVQRREITRQHEVAAYWGTLAMGVVVWAGLSASAPLVASFFREPRMAPLLQVVALAFLINPVATIPRAALQRKLEFRPLLAAETVGVLVYAASGIGLALRGYSYWALAWASVAATAASALSFCAITRRLPPIVPRFAGLAELWSFGFGKTLEGALYHVSQQVDNLVVGRWLGVSALGVYQRAFNLSHAFFGIASTTLGAVLFPAFARLQEDPGRAAAAFRRALTALAFVTAPPLVILAVVTPEFIPLLLGAKWETAVVPTQVLVVAAILRTLALVGTRALVGMGRVYLHSACVAIYAGSLLLGALAGTRWGTVGVSVAAVGATLLYGVTTSYLVARAIGLRAGALGVALRGPLVCILAVALAAGGARALALSHDLLPVWSVVTATAAGLAAWAAVAWLLPFEEFRRAWRDAMPSRQPGSD
jgi:O-antigen/teichoic acid export membrane protein